MKKIITTLTFVGLMFGASAQNNKTTEEMYKEFRLQFQQRDYSKQHLKSSIQLGTPSAAKAKAAKSLPSDRVWFPGEWEEVKAIVVTPFYHHLPATSQGSGSWSALPLVTGWSQYYKYSNGWREGGMGPYKSVMDTTSNFGKVFFYLMDGIQLGGAQAWVHVEHPKDSLTVLRTLSRMGLRHDNVRFIVGAGNSFWYRDCGPIAFYYGDQDSVGMLDFTYYPDRVLDDSLPSLIHQHFGIPNYNTDIEWEGGNCLVDGAGMVLSSDAIYTSNTDAYGPLVWDGQDINTLRYKRVTPLSEAQVAQGLHDLLGQRATYIIPAYQHDGGTGHIDLYADMYDENGFVFSVMPNTYSSWTDYRIGARNIDSLCSWKSLFERDYYTMSTLPFPSADNGDNFTSQFQYNDDYTRTYSNHTFVNNVILQPCFSRVVNGQPSAQWDRDNLAEIQKAYPGYTLYPVDVREFDGSGGAIHCVTKQIPADNPIRILHKNIHGALSASYASQDLPVSAIVTNRSGIAHAEVVYRVNGGNWDTLNLTANGNRFYGSFPFQGLNTAIDSVDYYISATSNNGKTITKPMTASQGGYYRFSLNSNDLPDSSMFDYDTTPMPMTNITFAFGSNWVTEDTNAPRPVGIEQVESAEQLFGQFYPNPATDQANLRVDLAGGNRYNVSIIDQSGRTVHTSCLQASGAIVYTINTSRLAAGSYIVIFENKDSRVSRKLMVK